VTYSRCSRTRICKDCYTTSTISLRLSRWVSSDPLPLIRVRMKAGKTWFCLFLYGICCVKRFHKLKRGRENERSRKRRKVEKGERRQRQYVLVHPCCCNRVIYKEQKFIFSQLQRLGSQRSRHWCPGRDQAASSHGRGQKGKGNAHSCEPFHKGITPTNASGALMTESPVKGSNSQYHYLGSYIATWILKRTDIQIIAPWEERSRAMRGTL
jgi:hypothetical protein